MHLIFKILRTVRFISHAGFEIKINYDNLHPA